MTTAKSSKDLAAIPIWQQGSVDLSTNENLKKRLKCRHDDGVLAALDAFWRVANTFDDDDDDEASVTEQGYAIFALKFVAL